MLSVSLPRGKALFASQIAILLLLLGTLYFGRRHFSVTSLHNKLPSHVPWRNVSEAPSEATSEAPSILPDANLTAIVEAILHPAATVLPRLQCPTSLDEARYEALKSSSLLSNTTTAATRRHDDKLAYFFAIDLRDNLDVIPRLLGTVVEAIRFLGPASCALSIVEGKSRDGTPAVLHALAPALEKLSIAYDLVVDDSIDTRAPGADRIEGLAALRNEALAPLLSNPRAGPSTSVIFLNDVVLCPEDVLELILQRRALGADMVCGLDWVILWRDPTFYDVWVSRTLTGNTFFNVPESGSWDEAWNLFFAAEDEPTRSRFAEHKPFQVFACWNGGVVFGAAPLLSPPQKTAQRRADAEGPLRFRKPREGECGQGEPQLFCKDMWWRGHGRIAVVPTVNLEYGDENAQKIKELKGYVSGLVGKGPPTAGDVEADRIIWQDEPPEQVKCVPSFDRQTWRPWNESMA